MGINVNEKLDMPVRVTPVAYTKLWPLYIHAAKTKAVVKSRKNCQNFADTFAIASHKNVMGLKPSEQN